jgi:hypothetical protein
LAASGGGTDGQSVILNADKATTVNVSGSTKLTVTLTDAGNNNATFSPLVNKIDASTFTAPLVVDLTLRNGAAVALTGGTGADVLNASFGTNAKADTIVGGGGNDTIYAGSNGAVLTGGTGSDLFLVYSPSTTSGNKEVNTYSTITDFQAGDLLKLNAFYDNDGGGNNVAANQKVASFAKLAAALNPATSTFLNYVTAAMEQAKNTTAGVAGDAVWFMFGGNSYIVIDNGAETAGTFVNDQDLIVQLTGVDLTTASFNSTYGTIAIGG